MEKKRLVVAVDGHSSTGKSTVSKILAAHLKYTYIDTGAMYRMVTYAAMQTGILNDGEEIDEVRLRTLLEGMTFGFIYNETNKRYESYLDGKCVEEAIRRMDVADRVSGIATLPYVREVLVEKQREMATQGGVIMDGRDIGSVVLPLADVKFFMTADPAIRANRRYQELLAKGEQVSYEAVEENVRKRDYLDEHRTVSPLVRVPEAVFVDTGNMTVEEVVTYMLNVIQEHYAG